MFHKLVLKTLVAASFVFVSCSHSDEILEEEPTTNPEIKEGDKALAVDLGLSVKWSDINVGASSVKEIGDYYSWGEISTKKNYSWSTYKFGKDWGALTKYTLTDKKFVLDAEDDVAHVKWGGAWRMPTIEEFQELINKCTCTWTIVNGVKGLKVLAPNKNSIFLPAGGSKWNDDSLDIGSVGNYWTSSFSVENAPAAWYIRFGKDEGIEWNCDRNDGFTIRPVQP